MAKETRALVSAPRKQARMSIIDSVRKSLVPIHPEGYVFIAGFAAVSFLLDWLSPTLGWMGFIATAWCAYFFRNPPRVTPLREGLVISPRTAWSARLASSAAVRTRPGSRADAAHLGVHERLRRAVNRAPITGRISRIAYKPGLFVNADLDKASDDNERSGMVIEAPSGRFGVVQIAGLSRGASSDSSRKASKSASATVLV
jgi:phosphatidylserine decarboxylase